MKKKTVSILLCRIILPIALLAIYVMIFNITSTLDFFYLALFYALLCFFVPLFPYTIIKGIRDVLKNKS